MTCRCAETSRLDGAESREYALGHLIEREVGDGVSRRDHEWGFGWWRCPLTGWQFESASHDDGSARWLRRLPYTTAEDYLDRELVARRAEEIAISHRLVHETFVHRSESEAGHRAWSEAATRAKEAVKAMESPDLRALIGKLSGSDPMAVEAAIVYLEVDPWCFRSGYLKETILRRLSRAHLSEAPHRGAPRRGRRVGPQPCDHRLPRIALARRAIPPMVGTCVPSLVGSARPVHAGRGPECAERDRPSIPRRGCDLTNRVQRQDQRLRRSRCQPIHHGGDG